MNASLAGFATSLAGWLGDFYLLATLLLGTVFLGFRWVRQPVRRLSVAWIVTIELAVLAVACARPGWPRISSLVAATPRPNVSPLSRPGGNAADKAGATEEHMSAVRKSPEPSDPRHAEFRSRPPRAGFRRFPRSRSCSALVFLAGAGLTGLWLCCARQPSLRVVRRATAARPPYRPDWPRSLAARRRLGSC